MGDQIQLLPPTSLANAVKQGGDVFESWLNHQTILAQPRVYREPPDTRVPWNKSHVGMEENNGPSFARIYYIARPKRVVGTEVHTRSESEVVHVTKAALKYKITDHMMQMAQPKKVYPADENEPWHLKKGKYKLSERLAVISQPRKSYPSTDRPFSEIGHPPRAALYGRPPSKSAGSKPARPPPPPPPPSAPPPAASATTAAPPPAATSSSAGLTTSSTGPTTSTTGPTTSSTGPTTSSTGPTTSSTGATASVTAATASSTGATASSTTAPTGSSSGPTSSSSSAEASGSSAESAPPSDTEPADAGGDAEPAEPVEAGEAAAE